MSSQEKNALQRARRREKQSKIRQALVITDYVYAKYSAIYQEAAAYYNELNSLYPTKSDLTRCDEFKALKMIANGAPIRIRKYNKVHHANILLEQRLEIPVQPLGQPESSTGTVQPAELEQRLEIPVQPLEQPESSTGTVQSVEQPESSTGTVQSVELEQRFQIPVQPLEQSESSTGTVQSVEQSESSTSTVQPTVEKVMELKIPLFKTSVVTQTLQTHTEETIQENPLTVAAEVTIQETPTFHPSLMDEIPQNVIDRIVSELREDPQLETIMTEIEEDIEFEQLGMELDIPIDDRLENDLENLIW